MGLLKKRKERLEREKAEAELKAAEAAEEMAGTEEAAEEMAGAEEVAEEAVEEMAGTEEAVEEMAGAEEAAEEAAEAAEETAEEAVEEASVEITEASNPSEEAADETVDNAPEEASETAADETVGEPEKKAGFFRRLVEGLTKTRKNIMGGFDSIFSGHSAIDDDFYEELEEILIMGDLGVHATESILENLRQKVKENHIKQPADCRQYLIDSIKEQMHVGETAYRFEEQPSVVLVIGVNGVGKTTTIGKLAGQLKGSGKRVMMAAADTFRAAAGEQLTEWAHRAGVDIISAQEGSDPGSVVYDAVHAAKARKIDILLCDTAGRLHNKKNLMEELKKINRIIDKEYPEAYRESLVVVDATTGQNALAQAKQFSEATDITGIVLTKMDGTAKGGIAVAIQSDLGIPVKYIGVGEKIEDLQKFDADQFVDALFEQEA